MTGGAPQLGNWQLQQVLTMTHTGSPWWEAEVGGWPAGRQQGRAGNGDSLCRRVRDVCDAFNFAALSQLASGIRCKPRHAAAQASHTRSFLRLAHHADQQCCSWGHQCGETYVDMTTCKARVAPWATTCG